MPSPLSSVRFGSSANGVAGSAVPQAPHMVRAGSVEYGLQVLKVLRRQVDLELGAVAADEVNVDVEGPLRSTRGIETG